MLGFLTHLVSCISGFEMSCICYSPTKASTKFRSMFEYPNKRLYDSADCYHFVLGPEVQVRKLSAKTFVVTMPPPDVHAQVIQILEGCPREISGPACQKKLLWQDEFLEDPDSIPKFSFKQLTDCDPWSNFKKGTA
jgi:hypothetical protein